MKKTTTKQETKKTKSLIAKNSSITITIKKDEAKKNYQKSLKKLAKTVKADGFRKGKTPLPVAEKMIGQAKIIDDAINAILPLKYEEEIKKSKKKPISRPKFIAKSVEIDKDWIIEAQFAQEPKIVLGSYKKHVVEGRKKAKARITKIEKDLKEGAAKEDKKKDKGKTPSSGRPSIPSKLTDKQKKDITLESMIQELVAKVKPEIPEILVEEEVRQEWMHLNKTLSDAKMKVEDYLKQRQITGDQLIQELTARTLGRIQINFILHEIVKEQKIKASEADIKKKIEEIKDEKLRFQVEKSSRYQNHFRLVIEREKVIDYLESIK